MVCSGCGPVSMASSKQQAASSNQQSAISNQQSANSKQQTANSKGRGTVGWRAQHCKSPSASRCCASCVLISLSKYPGMNVECKANHFCQHTQGVRGGVGGVGFVTRVVTRVVTSAQYTCVCVCVFVCGGAASVVSFRFLGWCGPLKSTTPSSPSSYFRSAGTVGTTSLPGYAWVRDPAARRVITVCTASTRLSVSCMHSPSWLTSVGLGFTLVNPLPLSPRRGSATSPDDHIGVLHYPSKHTGVAACYASVTHHRLACLCVCM